MPPARHPRPAASSSTTTNTQPPSLPQYEPPTAPLNPAAKRALAGLLESHTVRRLKDHIRHAGEKLTDSAGEVNERVTDERVRHEKRTTRDREAGKEEDEDEKENLEKREEEVRNITADLDKGMRGIVDSDVKLAGLVGGIGHLERDAERESGVGGPPVEVLRERIAREGEEWEGRSLVDRYSSNNAYVGFYRVVHDAKHPGDEVPPLPHASTWFSRLQDPAAEASQSQSQPGSHLGKREREPSPAESDIAIERERISLKCPITLLTFIDPVTSTKCPHSFERSAIEDMLKQTTLSKPGPGGRRNRVKYIKCPICSLELTAQDLRTDLPLLRKVKRAEDISQREAEEEEFDGRGSKRRITLGSEMGSEDSEDDEDEATGTMNDPVRIKQEQAAS